MRLYIFFRYFEKQREICYERLIVSVFPDLVTGYALTPNVADPFKTLQAVVEYTEPWHGHGKLLRARL